MIFFKECKNIILNDGSQISEAIYFSKNPSTLVICIDFWVFFFWLLLLYNGTINGKWLMHSLKGFEVSLLLISHVLSKEIYTVIYL